MLKRKNGQLLLSDMMVTKKLKADPVHPTDSIHLDVDEHYTVNENVYYDSVKSDLFLKQIKGQNKKIEDFNDSDISMEQQIIRDRLLCLETRENMLITGEAGTGKTFVQMSLIKALKEAKQNVFRIGPTHGSVANLPNDSSTYQTFFSMTPSNDYLDLNLMKKHIKDMQNAALRQPFIQRAKHRQSQSTLIIEEAGMISAEVIDLILATLNEIAPDRFRVYLFFDILQLAPVQGNLLVHSEKIQLTDTLILKTNMRQTNTEDDFLDLLRSTAKNTLSEYHYEILKSRRTRVEKKFTRRICARNVTVDAHNLAHLNSLPSEKYTFRALDEAVKKMPDYGLARSPRWISWGIGAKIVFESTPLHSIGLYNGVTGEIIDMVGTDTNMVLPVIYIEKYHSSIVVHPYKEEIMTEVTGTTVPTIQAYRTQFPFSIAAATTVHKVQGQTLTGPVEIDLKDMTSPGQTYTALSRLTKLENLFLKNLPADRYGGGIDGLRVSEMALSWCKNVHL